MPDIAASTQSSSSTPVALVKAGQRFVFDGTHGSSDALLIARYHLAHKAQVPLLAVWGKNDPFFLPPGAEAYKRDLPNAEVHFLDAGHFALETHAAEIAVYIGDFLGRQRV